MNKTTLCLFIKDLHRASIASGVSAMEGEVEVGAGAGAELGAGGASVVVDKAGGSVEEEACWVMRETSRGAFEPE